MSRRPVRASYDAIVDALPLGGAPTSAYALIKRTFQLGRAGLSPAPATPLFHDLRDPNVVPRLVPGCEFYPFKRQTDVVVRGYAYGRGGAAVPGRTVALRVGDRVKTIDVIGRRVARVESGRVRFDAPEPFVRMPMSWREAYGGVDPRVPWQPEAHGSAHPGVYPRNPLGKGYVVLPGSIEVELPNLEDPSHRLTEDALVVGEPDAWPGQPLPWCFEYTLPLMFPRRQWLGGEAALALPASVELEEVRRGFLRPDWREASAGVDPESPPPEFYQEAPFGQRLAPLGEGVEIVVEGMSPDREVIAFTTPRAPAVELLADGRPEPVQATLGTLLLEPALDRASFVWIARLDPLPAPLRSRAAGGLPLAVVVDGDTPVPYEAPPGVRFVDVTAPIVIPEDIEIPLTGETELPEPRAAYTTLKLTTAQLTGEEPAPMRDDTDPSLTLDSLDAVIGTTDEEDDLTDLELRVDVEGEDEDDDG